MNIRTLKRVQIALAFSTVFFSVFAVILCANGSSPGPMMWLSLLCAILGVGGIFVSIDISQRLLINAPKVMQSDNKND